jgi:hypothetical protein
MESSDAYAARESQKPLRSASLACLPRIAASSRDVSRRSSARRLRQGLSTWERKQEAAPPRSLVVHLTCLACIHRLLDSKAGARSSVAESLYADKYEGAFSICLFVMDLQTRPPTLSRSEQTRSQAMGVEVGLPPAAPRP